MNDHPTEQLAQAFRDLMEQHRQDELQRLRRIAELKSELSEATERYRQQSAAVMPGSGQDLNEFYDWRHAREQELANLRFQQHEAERLTLPQIARVEAESIIRHETRTAMPENPKGSDGAFNFRKLLAYAARPPTRVAPAA